MRSDVPRPGTMPEGGVFYAEGRDDEGIECDRCGQLATKNYEGDAEFLSLCDGCFDALGRWLNG